MDTHLNLQIERVYIAPCCMLGKLGNNSKFLYYKGRAMMLGTFEVIKHKNKELLSTVFPTHSSPLHFQDLEFRAPVPITTRKEDKESPTAAFESGGTMDEAAGQGYPPHNPCHCLYVVIMEAVDPDGVALLYQAHIQLHDLKEGMWLEAFYRCYNSDRIMYQRVYHYLVRSFA
ncbi:hypothetical protein ABKV19_009257 [Rosa sericea]